MDDRGHAAAQPPLPRRSSASRSGSRFALGWLLTGTLAGAPHRAALGRARADLLRPPHHLVDQLDLPLLRPPPLRHRRQSTNVWWLSLASLGEAWHHNHHAFPRSAVHGLRRWELDPSAASSALMQRVGLAWNVVRSRPSARAQRARRSAHRLSRVATWILTGSLENFRINVERGFDVVGFKERRRNQALEFEPGDEIVFYVTGVQAFGGIARVRSEMFEDRAPIWPQGKKKHPEDYPWRVEAEPVVVLDEDALHPGRVAVGELSTSRQVAGRALAPGVPGAAADDLRRRREAARRADRAASRTAAAPG